MTILLLFGGFSGVLAGLLFYVAGANQRLLARAWPARLGLLPGLLCSLVSAWFLQSAMGKGSAIFALITLLMTMLTVLPFLMLLLRRPAGRGR